METPGHDCSLLRKTLRVGGRCVGGGHHDPERFVARSEAQQPELVQENNTAMTAPVTIVHLRRPRSDDPRTDPLYEFGSFGLTGCHRTNLLADRDAAGCRLAFAQGGDLGFRLVMVTPPVDIRELAHVCEAIWSPGAMPLRYETAPLLIDNDGTSDVDGMREFLDGVNRSTWRERFSSSFRTRKQPLDAALAASLVRAWDRAIEDSAQCAEAYWEALPYWDPEAVDRDRHGTHQTLLMRARGETARLEEDEGDELDDESSADVLRAKCRPARRPLEPKPSRNPRRRC